MMYEPYQVVIPYEVYCQWQVYGDYLKSNFNRFQPYVMDRYPEVLGMKKSGHTIYGTVTWTFVFESESHYRWFLLQVM